MQKPIQTDIRTVLLTLSKKKKKYEELYNSEAKFFANILELKYDHELANILHNMIKYELAIFQINRKKVNLIKKHGVDPRIAKLITEK